MDETLYLSIGKASQELGASGDTLRALCKSGAVKARLTVGGQWRIPLDEVDRLKRYGLPPTPRPMPGDGAIARNGPHWRAANDETGAGDPHRLAGQSQEAVDAYKAVHKKRAIVESEELDLRQNEVALRKLDLQGEIDQRLRRESDQKRKAAEEIQRADWVRQWEEDALTVFDQEASGANPELRLEFHQAVRSKLAQLNPIPSQQVTAGLIRDIKGRYIRRHDNVQEIVRMARAAMESLPPQARVKTNGEEHSAWEIRLLEAIEAARPDDEDPLETNQRKVRQALAEVTREFEQQQAELHADCTDSELRRSVREEVTLSFRHRLTSEAQDDMDEAMEAEFAKWPRGTKRHRLVAAIQQAASTWSRAVEEFDGEQCRLVNQAKQKEDAEAAVRRDREIRDELLRWPYLDLPYSFSHEDRDRLVAAARKNMDKLPCGASRETLVQARDAVIVPAVMQRNLQQKKRDLINQGLREIAWYVLKKRQQGWDLGPNLNLAHLENAVREQLEDELRGDEPMDRVKRIVQWVVREELDLGIGPAAA